MSGLVISPRYRLSVGEVRLHGRCGAARGRQEAKRSCRRAAVQCQPKFQELGEFCHARQRTLHGVRADCLATIYY